MYNVIKEDNVLLYITKSQFITWWGTNLPDNILDIIMNYYDKVNKTYDYDSITKRIKQIFLECKDDRKKFAETVIEYFTPTDREKKNNAEIPTPRELKLEMISKVPKEFWTEKQKVLEPSVGKGGFCLEVIECFMIGLKELYPDENERYKIIVEECLYFADINPVNIHITKLIIDPNNEYKLNYYEGDFLKFELKYFELEGFDLVIGNPPYQAVSENGISKGGGNNLYTKFIYLAYKILLKNGYLLFINPPTYFSPGRSNNKNNMSLRKDVLNNYYYHYINLEECSKHFNVGSKFIYYLIEKNNDINKKLQVICKYENKIYSSIINQKLLVENEYLPYLLTNNCLNILSKIKNNKCDKLQIFNSTVFDKRRDYVLNKTKKETFEEYKKRANKNKYIYPIQATGSQVVYSQKPCKNQKNKKILMSESGYLKPFFDNGILGVGGHCFACLVENKTKANYIIKLINSKLYTFYIEVNKWSGFHNRNVLQDLPYVKITNITDEKLYEYFKITDDEIKLIEKCGIKYESSINESDDSSNNENDDSSNYESDDSSNYESDDISNDEFKNDLSN
jgi:hypothetical protein